MPINPWINIIHNEPIKLRLHFVRIHPLFLWSRTSSFHMNKESPHYITNMNKQTLKAHLLFEGHCVKGAKMFKVSFPSSHEVNDDATLAIYYVVFSNIKLISRPGLMNHRCDETKRYLINLSIMLISYIYIQRLMWTSIFYFICSEHFFNASQCLYMKQKIINVWHFRVHMDGYPKNLKRVNVLPKTLKNNETLLHA